MYPSNYLIHDASIVECLGINVFKVHIHQLDVVWKRHLHQLRSASGVQFDRKDKRLQPESLTRLPVPNCHLPDVTLRNTNVASDSNSHNENVNNDSSVGNHDKEIVLRRSTRERNPVKKFDPSFL